MTFREAKERARKSLQSYAFNPLRRFVGNLLSVADELIDRWYFLWDLWSVPPTYLDAENHIDYGQKITRGEADYSKVRGHVAFWIAVYMDIRLFNRTQELPGIVALLAPVSLLAYSMGERVFLAFLKALPAIVGNWRGKALEAGVTFQPHEWATGEPDAGIL